MSDVDFITASDAIPLSAGVENFAPTSNLSAAEMSAKMCWWREHLRNNGTSVSRNIDGHFYLSLVINGIPVRFVADTGASNMVLTQKDAERLGINPADLVYLGQARTANGTVRTARVKLPVVELGPYRDENFPAWVNEGEMFGSLLGMEYLSLYRVEIAGDRMILRR